MADWRHCDPSRGSHYHGGGLTCQCGAQASVSMTGATLSSPSPSIKRPALKVIQGGKA